MDVSVLVPAKDEAENLPLFMEQAAIAFAGTPKTTYEVVVIDDGSTDDTPRVLRELQGQYSFLRVATHRLELRARVETPRGGHHEQAQCADEDASPARPQPMTMQV